MLNEPVPFHRAALEGRELELVAAAAAEGPLAAGGPNTAVVCDLLRTEHGAADVLLTTSCTAALELAALLLDVGTGDTVVVPSFGFVTTALAFARQGARIAFCDVDPTGLGLDPGHLESLMDDRVRAVVPIHYAGIACDVEGIEAVLADWPRAELVEDNAHGLFGRHGGRPLGSFGRFSTLSFHETKAYVCGEGGALVVNRSDDVARARVVHDKGTDRQAFLAGAVDHYDWQDTGSSFGLSDLLAAHLRGQLEQRASIQARRRAAFERYQADLAPLASAHGLGLPAVPPGAEPAYQMYPVLLPEARRRDDVVARLQAAGVDARFHYLPLHRSPYGQQVAAGPACCPVTDDVSARLLRLPFFAGISPAQQARVVAALQEALASG